DSGARRRRARARQLRLLEAGTGSRRRMHGHLRLRLPLPHAPLPPQRRHPRPPARSRRRVSPGDPRFRPRPQSLLPRRPVTLRVLRTHHRPPAPASAPRLGVQPSPRRRLRFVGPGSAPAPGTTRRTTTLALNLPDQPPRDRIEALAPLHRVTTVDHGTLTGSDEIALTRRP